jgi:hypothetical protein
MKATLSTPLLQRSLSALSTLAWQAMACGELVRFTENYAEGARYATVKRGQHQRRAVHKPRSDRRGEERQPIPSGTVITMEDYRDGKLFRYVVMEKRMGWGAEYLPEKRNGEWEFQAFNADKTVNRNENLLLLPPQGAGKAGLRVHLRSHEERQIGTGLGPRPMTDGRSP